MHLITFSVLIAALVTFANANRFFCRQCSMFMWQLIIPGNVIGCISKLNECWAQLVLGWLSVGRHVNHLGM